MNKDLIFKLEQQNLNSNNQTQNPEKIDFLKNFDKIENNEELGVSPASIPLKSDVNWFNGTKIYNHYIYTNNKTKFNIFTSDNPLDIPYRVSIKFTQSKYFGYTLVGLINKKINDLYDFNYLGEITGEGSIGLGNSGYVSIEGKTINYRDGKILEGSIVTIEGNDEEVKFEVNDELVYSYKFKNRLNNVYLAANCYYDDILEIV
jgi:hypothetical protein